MVVVVVVIVAAVVVADMCRRWQNIVVSDAKFSA